MLPIGYLYKEVSIADEYLKSCGAQDVYSVSGCISESFADYLRFWKHNGFWLFNSPSVMERLALEQSISLSGMTLFYYEVYEKEYDPDRESWEGFEADRSFHTDVVLPSNRALQGYDVVVAQGGVPQHSPLSCSDLAKGLRINEHCLLATFDEAKRAIESGLFKDNEPGPLRIIAVYLVNDAQHL